MSSEKSSVLVTGGSVTTPFSNAAVAKLLAYHTPLTEGTDLDQSRNLATSVTVE